MELAVEELQHILLDLTALEAKAETDHTKKLLSRERQARSAARAEHPMRLFLCDTRATKAMEAKLVERTRAEREAAEAVKPRTEQTDATAAPFAAAAAAVRAEAPSPAPEPAPPTCPSVRRVPVARPSLPPSIVRTTDERLTSYAWDQSDKAVTIYVPYAGAKTGEEKIQFQCLGEYDFEVIASSRPHNVPQPIRSHSQCCTLDPQLVIHDERAEPENLASPHKRVFLYGKRRARANYLCARDNLKAHRDRARAPGRQPTKSR